MKLKVVSPYDVAIDEAAFPEVGRFQVLVVLGMRVSPDETANIDSLLRAIAELEADRKVFVAAEADDMQVFSVHSFFVITVRRTVFL